MTERNLPQGHHSTAARWSAWPDMSHVTDRDLAKSCSVPGYAEHARGWLRSIEKGRMEVFRPSADGKALATIDDIRMAFHDNYMSHGVVRMQLDFLLKRIEELEREVAELKQRPQGITYRGYWSSGAEYKAGDAVHHKGSLFVATIDCHGCEPTAEITTGVWGLAAKRGRDGRHGKDATK